MTSVFERKLNSITITGHNPDGSVMGTTDLAPGLVPAAAQRYVRQTVWVRQAESDEVRRTRLLHVATRRRARLGKVHNEAKEARAAAAAVLEKAQSALSIAQAAYAGAKRAQYILAYGGDV